MIHQFIGVCKFCSYKFLENTDEDSNEENTEIDENPSVPIQTGEIDQPVEEPESSPVTPVPNQDETGFTQGEINQDSSNSSNTTEQTITSTKTISYRAKIRLKVYQSSSKDLYQFFPDF